jgi:hypothetical protein
MLVDGVIRVDMMKIMYMLWLLFYLAASTCS